MRRCYNKLAIEAILATQKDKTIKGRNTSEDILCGLNRKQIPLCSKHYGQIHSGKLDPMTLKDHFYRADTLLMGNSKLVTDLQ